MFGSLRTLNNDNIDQSRALALLSVVISFSINDISFCLWAILVEWLKRYLLFVEIAEFDEGKLWQWISSLAWFQEEESVALKYD